MTTDIARPEMEVKLPLVKLTLADLAYLRSLAQKDASVRCHPSEKTLDKLRFLDLIARAKVPVTSEKVEEINLAIEGEFNRLKDLFETRQWYAISGYKMLNLERQLEPTEENVLTSKGKLLLQNGEVKINVRKVGCV